MVGQKRGVTISVCCFVIFAQTHGKRLEADNSAPDLSFLEWLGQTADVDDTGISIDVLLEQYESKSDEPDQGNREEEKGQ